MRLWCNSASRSGSTRQLGRLTLSLNAPTLSLNALTLSLSVLTLSLNALTCEVNGPTPDVAGRTSDVGRPGYHLRGVVTAAISTSMKGGQAKRGRASKLRAALEELRVKMIAEAVDRHGNLAAAAQELGVSPITIYRVLRRHGYGFETHTVKTIKVRRPK